MEFQQQALQVCENISTLTGVYCTLLDMQAKHFCKSPFRESCTMENGICSADMAHSAGCAEASRWNGRYMYRCPCGYMFLAVSLRQLHQAEYGLIAGPFVLSDSGTPDVGQAENGQIPCLTMERARALGEIAQALCGYLAGGKQMSVSDSDVQKETLHTMYSMMQCEERISYPIEDERRLQQLIRSGEKKEAQQLLNDLLLELYLAGGNDLLMLKLRIRDLITLMSRAATDSGADVTEVLALCDRSVIEMERMRDFDSLDAWLGAMLHRFFDLVFDFNDAKHQNIIRQVSSYIQEHLSEKLTLEQVAGEVHLSKSYLCRILKEELGCTFTEYANRLRIERSKTYLHRSAMPLSEIACAVGFDDQSYFTRIFKRVVGMPPGKYRANNLSA
ncbi:helix-turn-helix transcriptional regulator [Butyricicoccus sp.]|uniref:helix-turn-helix transcriptional regulator n=1 Tax=Butyricicoccus sp. TaxID=2049021 RepID=UPI0037351EC6